MVPRHRSKFIPGTPTVLTLFLPEPRVLCLHRWSWLSAGRPRTTFLHQARHFSPIESSGGNATPIKVSAGCRWMVNSPPSTTSVTQYQGSRRQASCAGPPVACSPSRAMEPRACLRARLFLLFSTKSPLTRLSRTHDRWVGPHFDLFVGGALRF
jgi:hypothetical protein